MSQALEHDPFPEDWPDDWPRRAEMRRMLMKVEESWRRTVAKAIRFLCAGLSDDERKEVPRIRELFSAQELEALITFNDVKTQWAIYRSLILQSRRLGSNMRVSASNTHIRRSFIPLFAAIFEAQEQLQSDWERGYIDQDEAKECQSDRKNKSPLVEKALKEILNPDVEFAAGQEAVKIVESGLPFSIPISFKDEVAKEEWIARQRRKLSEEKHWFGN